jgi:hypothetical protein
MGYKPHSLPFKGFALQKLAQATERRLNFGLLIAQNFRAKEYGILKEQQQSSCYKLPNKE